jgi:hypothetical protein
MRMEPEVRPDKVRKLRRFISGMGKMIGRMGIWEGIGVWERFRPESVWSEDTALFVPGAVVLLSQPLGGPRGLTSPLAALAPHRMEPERSGRTSTTGMGAWWGVLGVSGGRPGVLVFTRNTRSRVGGVSPAASSRSWRWASRKARRRHSPEARSRRPRGEAVAGGFERWLLHIE